MKLDNCALSSDIDMLTSLKLFSGVDRSVLEDAAERGEFKISHYSAGELIYSPSDSDKRLTVFLSGEAEVYSIDENRTVLLRSVTSGGIVGVANLFSDEKYVSRVTAVKKCDTLEIGAESFGKILEADRQAMYNYISFLSNRICYLNKKIVCLTAGSSERRLAYFLDSALSEQQERGGSKCEILIQMNSLCEMLNLGRASLYRAADKLCEEGFIAREGKKVTVLNREGMINKYK